MAMTQSNSERWERGPLARIPGGGTRLAARNAGGPPALPVYYSANS